MSAAAVLGAIALVTGAEGEPPPCNSCKAQEASWDWKANGYAVAGSPEEAQEDAIHHALERGCAEAYRYLDQKKLACAAGCAAGQLERACKPKELHCTGSSYTLDKDQWLLACRKRHKKDAATACNESSALASPFFAMCDVPMLATSTLPCAPPNDGTCS